MSARRREYANGFGMWFNVAHFAACSRRMHTAKFLRKKGTEFCARSASADIDFGCEKRIKQALVMLMQRLFAENYRAHSRNLPIFVHLDIII